MHKNEFAAGSGAKLAASSKSGGQGDFYASNEDVTRSVPTVFDDDAKRSFASVLNSKHHQGYPSKCDPYPYNTSDEAMRFCSFNTDGLPSATKTVNDCLENVDKNFVTSEGLPSATKTANDCLKNVAKNFVTSEGKGTVEKEITQKGHCDPSTFLRSILGEPCDVGPGVEKKTDEDPIKKFFPTFAAAKIQKIEDPIGYEPLKPDIFDGPPPGRCGRPLEAFPSIFDASHALSKVDVRCPPLCDFSELRPRFTGNPPEVPKTIPEGNTNINLQLPGGENAADMANKFLDLLESDYASSFLTIETNQFVVTANVFTDYQANGISARFYAGTGNRYQLVLRRLSGDTVLFHMEFVPGIKQLLETSGYMPANEQAELSDPDCEVEDLAETTRISDLGVGGGQVDDDWAKHIAEALEANKSLQRIALRCNNISDAGPMPIAKEFRHCANDTMVDRGFSLAEDPNYQPWLDLARINNPCRQAEAACGLKASLSRESERNSIVDDDCLGVLQRLLQSEQEKVYYPVAATLSELAQFPGALKSIANESLIKEIIDKLKLEKTGRPTKIELIKVLNAATQQYPHEFNDARHLLGVGVAR